MFVANRRWLSTRGTEATLPTIDSGPTMVLECASCRPLCLLPRKARPRSIEGGRDGGDGGACGIGGKGVEVTLSAATTSRKAPNFIEEGATQSMLRSEGSRSLFAFEHTSNPDYSTVANISSSHSPPAEALALLCALSHVSWGRNFRLWWLQKLWKPSGPPEGRAHLGHVFRGQLRTRKRYKVS